MNKTNDLLYVDCACAHSGLARRLLANLRKTVNCKMISANEFDIAYESLLPEDRVSDDLLYEVGVANVYFPKGDL